MHGYPKCTIYMNLKILNSKEIKKLLNNIKNQFNTVELNLNYVFVINSENKIFIINKKIQEIDLNKLKINNIGLYFAKIEEDGIRLTIEGSEIISKFSPQNIIDITKEEAKSWFYGNDLSYNGNLKSYAILKHKEDTLGCGKIKNNRILNFIDKGRRIKTKDILYSP